MHRPRTRILSTLALTACTLMGAVGLARAEDPDDWSLGWGGGFEAMGVYAGPQLALATTELDRIARVLGLDEAQREEMMSLFYALEDEHLAAWVSFAEGNADAQNKGMSGKNDWAEIQKEQEEIARAFEEEQDRLVGLMLSDLELLVSPEQAERWGTIERERRRMDTLTRYGCYPGEQYDLVEVLHTLELDGDPAFASFIERYAEGIDPLLRTRNAALEKVGEASRASNRAQMEMYTDFDWEDPASMARYEELQMRVMEMQRDTVAVALAARPSCQRVAQFNEVHADELRGMLDGRTQREFDDLINSSGGADDGEFDFADYSRARQMFTSILNIEDMIGMYETWADSMGGEGWGIMRIARDMEPLTPKQASDIEELQERFEAEMEVLETRRPGMRNEQVDMTEWFFTLRTPDGDVTLQHNEPPEEMASGMAYSGKGGMYFVEGQEDGEEMESWASEKAQIEQRYIVQLRELLTLRQRAMISLQ
ncbi:MAG: hypothetical protein AAGH64_08670 [Planctomycetota bacterium]